MAHFSISALNPTGLKLLGAEVAEQTTDPRATANKAGSWIGHVSTAWHLQVKPKKSQASMPKQHIHVKHVCCRHVFLQWHLNPQSRALLRRSQVEEIGIPTRAGAPALCFFVREKLACVIRREALNKDCTLQSGLCTRKRTRPPPDFAS